MSIHSSLSLIESKKCTIKQLILISLQCTYIPDQYKAQKMFDNVVCKEPFMLTYFLDRYKTRKMCA